MTRVDFRKSATLALPVTIAVWLVSWIFGLLNLGVTPLFASVPATSIITGTIGQKVMGFLGGVFPISFNITTLFYVYVSAWIAIMIGTWLITQFKVPVFKRFLGFDAEAGRIASVLIWGAVPVYILLVGFSLPSATSIIGVFIHTIAVAWLTVWVANILKLRI